MPKRRKKKTVRQYDLSPGALPAKLSDKFEGYVLVFCDASKKTYAGIAAILFAGNCSEPLAFAATTAMKGSNELELEAALFALHQANLQFPDQPIALFSDNQDTVVRLKNVRQHGIASDPFLSNRFANLNIHDALNRLSVNWIKSHSHCRGNALADQYAREVANQYAETTASQSDTFDYLLADIP